MGHTIKRYYDQYSLAYKLNAILVAKQNNTDEIIKNNCKHLKLTTSSFLRSLKVQRIEALYLNNRY